MIIIEISDDQLTAVLNRLIVDIFIKSRHLPDTRVAQNEVRRGR